MTIAFPTVEGFGFDFASGEIDLNGKIYTAFENISHSQPLEEGWTYGASVSPLRRTRGQLKPGEGQLEWSDFEESIAFIESLGDGYREKIWVASMVYTCTGLRSVKVKLFGCRLLDEEFDHGQGPDGLGLSMPFSYHYRTINGKRPMKNQPG
ncbi:MAG: hypothetical protein H0U56_15640 [Methylibium sp.]|nr:hypothetical protein [Methylibium sp.]